MANETKATKVTEFTIKIDENKLITTDVKSFYPPHASMLNRATRIAIRDLRVRDRKKSMEGYYAKMAEKERKANAAKKVVEEKAKEETETPNKAEDDSSLSDPNVPQASKPKTKEEPKSKES